MTRRPVSVTPETTIERALTILRRGNFRHLPVVSDARLVGIVSDRDLQRATAAGTPVTASLAMVMNRQPISVTPETPVEHCAYLLETNKIGCLPVVNGNVTAGQPGDERLVGIITESDIFRAFVRAMGAQAPGTRVVVTLNDPVPDLLQAAMVLADRGATLLSLASEPLPGEDAGRLRLTMRLGTINPGPVIDALRRAGLAVDASWRKPDSIPEQRVD